MSRKALNVRHITTNFSWRVAERKRRRLVEEEARAGVETEFTSDGITLAHVISFKYLGQILTVVDNDWPAVVINLRY